MWSMSETTRNQPPVAMTVAGSEASGGAGAPEHFPPAVEAGADAVLAASIFHFGEVEIREVKQALADAGYEVRL